MMDSVSNGDGIAGYTGRISAVMALAATNIIQNNKEVKISGGEIGIEGQSKIPKSVAEGALNQINNTLRQCNFSS